MRALLIVGLFLAAGCVAPTATVTPASTGETLADVAARLSPIIGDLPLLHSVVDVETSYGLVNVDLYVPEMPGGEKVPVILVASPYNNKNGALNLQNGGKRGEENWISLPLYEWMREELLPRGYAFAQMDILGTRNSGGCQGIMNEAERRSTAEVVEWLAVQDWSTGKVGMVGKSYLGMSQIGAAVEAPEHLVTIVPISPPTHDYGYHYYNGVPYLGNHLTNFLYYGAFGLPPPDGDLTTYGPRYAERIPCAPEALAASFSTMGDYSARWQERDYRPLLTNLRPDLAVFFIAGHQDWNVKPDHPVDVFNAIPGPKLGLFGQWGHDYPNINNVDEDRWGEREDWYLTLHRWFDHHLKGIDTGLMAEAAACPVQTQDYDGVWRCANAFPPLNATPITLYPQADSSLGPEPGDGAASFHDLATPTGVEQAQYSWAVDQETRVFGTPEVHLSVATTHAYDAYLHAALAIVRNGQTEEVTWGYMSLRHRDGLESGEAITPFQPYDIMFRMYPVDLVLHPGDTLVLAIRGANGEASRVQMLPNPTPGSTVLILGDTTSLVLPTTPLDRTFTPPTVDEVPATHQQEDV